MIILYRTLLIATAIMLIKAYSKSTSKSPTSYPTLVDFFKKKPEIRKKNKLDKCDVEIHKEQCVYKTLPKKKHCLVLQNLIMGIMPQYISVIENTELKGFQLSYVSGIYVQTCARKVTFKTSPSAKFIVIPKILELSKVEAGISIPVPLADFQLFGAGEWIHEDLKMKIKFNKENYDAYSFKGYSEIDYLSITRIGEIFDVDILPNGPVSILLKNINLDTLLIRNCKVYGSVQPRKGNYEFAFSGEPSKEFRGAHIHVFITKSGNTKNLAILIELQDYSPVTLLKKIYGASISHVHILRDRNQTIALYVTSLPTANFSNTYTSHGSSRWIHRDSTFAPGAFLLVTLPFPKRKALDMKIELLAGGLSFSLPESENLSGDLILGAISPEKIIHIGVDVSRNNDKNYSKMKILKFTYFLYNDTYLAAVESHLSDEEELEELMPIGRPDLLTESNRGYYSIPKKIDNLDKFFKREENAKDESKREVEKKTNIIESKMAETNMAEANMNDPLTMAEQAGLL